MYQDLDRVSKFLSYILRHNPDAISIRLDSEGWVDIDTLILSANKHGEQLDRNIIDKVVSTSNKKRFTISFNGLKIRAAQGHSNPSIHIQYDEKKPPIHLYHGTATRFIKSIMQQGLISTSRHYVHLSTEKDTAISVGKRHGKPIILQVETSLMFQHGFIFYLTDNDVWLTKSIPVEYITILG